MADPRRVVVWMTEEDYAWLKECAEHSGTGVQEEGQRMIHIMRRVLEAVPPDLGTRGASGA